MRTYNWILVPALWVGLIGFGLGFGLGLGGCGDDDGGVQNDAATCFPTNCLSQGKNCGSIMDGCGQIIQCGSCTVPQVCGGAGVANVCGDGTCQSTTCVAELSECGQLSDGCSGVLECGGCTGAETCGGGGTANTCGTAGTPDAGLPGPDGGTVGLCDPTCMAQSGAVCCSETCGCSGTYCMPVCEEPYQWDCEMLCCFNYTNYQCK
ncbi:MAG: hypothetical protein ABI333_04270 [bacterium]